MYWTCGVAVLDQVDLLSVTIQQNQILSTLIGANSKNNVLMLEVSNQGAWRTMEKKIKVKSRELFRNPDKSQQRSHCK